MAEGRQAQYLVAAAVSLATMVAGCSLAWSTPVMPKFHNNETGFNITDKEISWMASLWSPGFMAGNLVTSFISEGFGRRAVILGSALPVVIGTIINLTTSTAWCLYVMRFLWGTGTGMTATISNIMSGSLAIQQYLGRIVQESEANVNVLILFGAFRLFAGIFASAIVDKIGRRPLLICSFFSCGISLIIVGAYFFIQPTSSPYYSYIPFIGIILTSMLSILGYETVVFLIIAEIFPLNVKSVAMTLQNILGGFFNFLSVKGFQEVKDVAGLAGVFWFYASVSVIGAAFSYFIVPETKGKSLREIQVALQGVLYYETDEKTKIDVVVKKDNEVAELKELKHDYS